MTGNGKNPGWDDTDDPFPDTGKTNGSGNGHDRHQDWWQETPWDHPLEELEAFDPASEPVPPYDRPWLIEGWLPLLETVGLGGPGGKGKTLLAHMLANAAARGGSWLGLPVQEMKSALVFCEDRKDDALWRQDDIARRFGPPPKGMIGLFPRRDKLYNYLAVFDRDGNLHETTFFKQLLEFLKVFARGEPLLTVLDTRSDVFWGNQNDERHARMFVRKICDRIARETNGIVILIFQPSMTGMASGYGTSGSVQWQAAFRAHLDLKNAGEDDDPAARILTLMKANYAEEDKTREIRWIEGVFVTAEELEAKKPDYEKAAEKGQLKAIFMAGFKKYEELGQPLSTNDNAHSYAPKKIAADYRQTQKTGKALKNSDMVWAMEELIRLGELRIEEIGPPSRRQPILRRAGLR